MPGLMMTAAGPKVLEFNVRLGDPETQALMHRIDDDFAGTLARAAAGDLNIEQPELENGAFGLRGDGCGRISGEGSHGGFDHDRRDVGAGVPRGNEGRDRRVWRLPAEGCLASRLQVPTWLRRFANAYAGRRENPFRRNALSARHRGEGPETLVQLVRRGRSSDG